MQARGERASPRRARPEARLRKVKNKAVKAVEERISGDLVEFQRAKLVGCMGEGRCTVGVLSQARQIKASKTTDTLVQ